MIRDAASGGKYEMVRRILNFGILGCGWFCCAAVSACPMCKDSISDPANGPAGHASSLPSGFNNSIYVMLVGLFLTIGFVAAGLVKAIRGADRRAADRLRTQDDECD